MTLNMKDADTIWCIFSVDNNYDQPNNNLIAWWSNKPSLEQVGSAIGVPFPGKRDEDTLFVVNVWKGEETLNPMRLTHYRLEEVPEGSLYDKHKNKQTK